MSNHVLTSVVQAIRSTHPFQVMGRVHGMQDGLILADLPLIGLGDFCWIARKVGSPVLTKVVSFMGKRAALAPFDEVQGISLHGQVKGLSGPFKILVPEDPRGLVMNCFGEIKDGAPSTPMMMQIDVVAKPPDPLSRKAIDEQFFTGIKVIDTVLCLGKGQRVGLVAGPGVGKSTLLGMIARAAEADIVICALIGERGREVNEFLDKSLNAEGRRRSVVIVSTSDEPPMRRVMAAYTAIGIAERMRSQGKNVLVFFDSLTRFGRALREIALATGELPVRGGYPVSTFAEVASFLERAGSDRYGYITALYTVLSDTSSSNQTDFFVDEVKSLLDGHIVLSEGMARQGVRPAVDITRSISRLNLNLAKDDLLADQEVLGFILARLEKDKDVLLFGGVADPELALMLRFEEEIKGYLSQKINEISDFNVTRQQLAELVQRFKIELKDCHVSRAVL